MVSAVQCPTVSREDIINSCGVDEVHDGVNYTRTACVIAVARAKETFEPYVHQLGFRLAHIARRLLPVAMYLLQKEGRILTGHEAFLKRIGACFALFVDQKVKACQEKCREDLLSTTQFVTWSLHSGNRAGVASVLGPKSGEPGAAQEPQRPMEGYDGEPRYDEDQYLYPDENVRGDSNRREHRDRDERKEHAGDRRRGEHRDEHRGRGGSDRDRRDKEKERSSHRDKKYDRYEEQHSKPSGPGPLASVPQNSGGVSNSKDVLALMDNTLWNRQMKDVTVDVVDLLVRQIYTGIRGYVVQSVELKFNCFFLMPLMNEFAGFLRQEMETQFEDNLDCVFDVRSLRAALEERQQKLEHELEQMEHIQEKFASIHNQLELQAQGSPATTAAATAARESGGGFQTAAEREIESTAVAMRASQEMAAEIKRANAGAAHHSPGKSFGSPQKRIPLGEMRNSVDFGR